MVVACQWLMDRDKTFLFFNMSDRRQGWQEVWNQPGEESSGEMDRWEKYWFGIHQLQKWALHGASRVVRRRRQARGGGPVSSVVAMRGALSENVPHGLIVWGLGPQLVVLSVEVDPFWKKYIIWGHLQPLLTFCSLSMLPVCRWMCSASLPLLLPWTLFSTVCLGHSVW